jgi:D-serine deaminase-like pyridoxal phosphate-dependent protein
MLLAAGASGLTVAKVGEAEVMSDVCHDVLIAYPAVDPSRTNRLARLACEHKVRVGIDSAVAAQSLAAAAAEHGSRLGILVDLDLGFGRTGVQSADEVLKLARTIAKLPGLRFDGVMFFPGHISGSRDQQLPHIERAAARLAEVLDLCRRDGLPTPIVSGGSTPTAANSHLFQHLTEIRPGTYVYNGVNELYGGYAGAEDCAARIVCTVVSTAVPGKVVLDGGSKAFTSDRCGPRPDSGHGLVVEYPEAKVGRLSEEHAEVDVSACDRRPRIGERVSVIPNHICPCVNLVDTFWWWENEMLTEQRVDARGRLS